jgi:hypothetical protein
MTVPAGLGVQVPVVVVSTGRCGSTMVSQLLGKHPEVLSLSEFWPNRVNLPELFSERSMTGREYWDLLSVPMAPDIYKIALNGKISQVPKRSLHETNYMRRIALPTLVEDYDSLFQEIGELVVSLPEAQSGTQICRMFDFIRRRLGKKVWVERTGASIDYLPLWTRMWPHMKAVHVYRDGRNTAISMSKHPAFRLMIKRKEASPDSSWLHIRPLDAATLSVEKFYEEDIPLERFGALWNDMVTRGLDELKKLPEAQRLDVRYEDIMANPVRELTRLISFIDPNVAAEPWVHEQAASLRPARTDWHELEEAEARGLTEACRPGLERLGYPC